MKKNLKKQKLKEFSSLIANAANCAAAAYGAHYYEHESSWRWRPCPEPFAVQAAYQSLKAAGYGVTAEAHQGGIFRKAGKEELILEGDFRRRYDLAVWAPGTGNRPPLALCEFKWLFGKGGFESDAENLALAKSAFGSEAVLCLLVAHNDRVGTALARKALRNRLLSRQSIRLSCASPIAKGEAHHYGFGTGEPVYFQSTVFCLQ